METKTKTQQKKLEKEVSNFLILQCDLERQKKAEKEIIGGIFGWN